MQNKGYFKGYYAVQGHQGWYQSKAPMRLSLDVMAQELRANIA